MVVGVVVGDDHTVDVGDGGAEGGEPGDQGVPGGRVVPAGVDEDGPPVGVDEVDQGVPVAAGPVVMSVLVPRDAWAPLYGVPVTRV